MKRNEKKLSCVRKNSAKRVSNVALIKYLDELARIHDLPDIGNPMLAEAIRGLVRAIRNRTIRLTDADVRFEEIHERRQLSKVGRRERGRASSIESADGSELSKWTEREIREFVMDVSRTKEDLLRLAGLRFSMPLSQLRRSRVDEIRNAIISALLHESSIEIISREAEREGKARSS